MKRFSSRWKGFTLVELLIVVAIIGVLSTVAIPSLRKMVQKARKTEAKVNLGGIYTAEAAFYAEYGAYGNNLNKIGFAIDGTNSIYVVGFPQSTDCKSNPDITPNLAAYKNPINASYPAYYISTTHNSVAGSTIPSSCSGVTASVPGDGQTFNAVAVGLIRAGASGNQYANMDVWSINQGRSLANVQDGVF